MMKGAMKAILMSILPAAIRVWIGPGRFEILDVGKPFRPEQLFGYVLRRNADARNLRKANGGGFRRRLLRHSARAANQTSGGSRGKRSEHAPATWHPLHDALLSVRPGPGDPRRAAVTEQLRPRGTPS